MYGVTIRDDVGVRLGSYHRLSVTARVLHPLLDASVFLRIKFDSLGLKQTRNMNTVEDYNRAMLLNRQGVSK